MLFCPMFNLVYSSIHAFDHTTISCLAIHKRYYCLFDALLLIIVFCPIKNSIYVYYCPILSFASNTLNQILDITFNNKFIVEFH